MKTIEIKLYEFQELSDEAKEKAREWYRRCSDGDNWWSESVIEEAVQQGELLGITFKTRDARLLGGGTRSEPCILWSGFWSQGDGACFEGSWSAKDCQPGKVAEGWGDAPETTEIKRIASVLKEIAEDWPEASFTINHHGRYYHEHSVGFDGEMYGDAEGIIQTDANAAEEDMREALRDFMRWIYESLKRAWDYENSDENVDENIRANEYLFEEDGTRSRHE